MHLLRWMPWRGRVSALVVLVLISVGGCYFMSSSTVKNDSKGSESEALKWEVFVTPGIPVDQAERPEVIEETLFQALASTLI